MIRTTDYQPATNGVDAAFDQLTADRLLVELETEGIVVLPTLLSEDQLRGMQRAFEARLQRLRWNNFDGYHKTELYRHMVEDVLLLDQGFVDLALHPLVKRILSRYLGDTYELTEAKGWKSLPTKRDFHGWHGDAWYDQETVHDIPREVKLAFYLTDVRSGAFNYVRGSHRQQHPRPVRNPEVEHVPASQILELAGAAGTAFLFDTSGIHRQGVPMLEPRRAIFYNYHDPSVPLQKEDVDYYRYHPILLNAAFLGNLTSEDERILGFGDKKNFVPAFERRTAPSVLYDVFGAAFNFQLRLSDWRERVAAKLRRVFGRS
jgi:hypothetical protein